MADLRGEVDSCCSLFRVIEMVLKLPKEEGLKLVGNSLNCMDMVIEVGIFRAVKDVHWLVVVVPYEGEVRVLLMPLDC